MARVRFFALKLAGSITTFFNFNVFEDLYPFLAVSGMSLKFTMPSGYPSTSNSS